MSPGQIRMKARFNGDRSKYGKRHKPGEMNQTESRYAEYLEGLKLAGHIIAWEFEAVTLKIATFRYTPDFMVLHHDGHIQFVDSKGGGPMDDKSRVKIKAAADKFWCFRFTIAKAKPKKLGGGWETEDF